MKARALIFVMFGSTVHSSGNTSEMYRRFGDECSGFSSCCADDHGRDVDAGCILSCTTLNSKLSACSAPCSSTADCQQFAQHGEQLQCIRVAGEGKLEQRDVSFAVAIIIGACVLGLLGLGCCALHKHKGCSVRRDVCAVCVSLTAASVVILSHIATAATHPGVTNVRLDTRLQSANGTRSSQRFCAPHSLLWVVGVSMTLAGSVSITFGTQLQKLAFNRQERAWQQAAAAAAAELDGKSTRELVPRKPWFKLALWWVGYVFLAVGAVSDFAAVGFAAQSLLAPLAASSLIINIIQAPCMLGEVPTLFDMFATLVICVGCTVSVIFADHTTRTYSLSDMLVLLVQPIFCTYLVGLLALMAYAGTTIARAKRDVRKVVLRSVEYSTQTLAKQSRADDDVEQRGVHSVLPQQDDEETIKRAGKRLGVAEDECDAEKVVELDAIERSRRAGSNLFAVYYAVLAGQCGGLTMLFAKMLSEIVKTLIQIDGLGAGWLTLAFATLTALLAACMIKQLQFLNEGFRLFDLLLIQPIYQATWITGTALNGMLFFQEYVDFTYTQWVMFPLGILLTVAGVVSLAARHSAQSPPPSPTRPATRSVIKAGLDRSHESRVADGDDVKVEHEAGLVEAQEESKYLLATATNLVFENENVP